MFETLIALTLVTVYGLSCYFLKNNKLLNDIAKRIF